MTRDYTEFEAITRVEVIERDPRSWDKDGNELVPEPSALEWADIPWSSHPEGCNEDGDEPWSETDKHMTTMCPDCFESWSCDHWIRVYEGTTLKLDTQQLAIRLSDQN